MNPTDYAAFDLILRATVVLMLAWAIAFFWKRASAAERHLMWSLTLAALIFLPVCRMGLPRWRVGILPAASSPAPPPVVQPIAADRAPDPAWNPPTSHSPHETLERRPADSATAPTTEVTTSLPAPLRISMLSWIWIAGAVLSLALVAVRHLALALGARRWPELADPAIIALARQAAQQLNVRLPRILQAESHTMPIVWCWRRPTLVLPATASAWPRDQLWAVLLHEIAHIKRRDCLTQLIGQISCALYWFHPLAWLALARMVRERERACDDLVLGTGVRPSDYTTTLVAVAREYRQNRILEPALPVARPSRLRERIQAILDNRQQRRLLGAHSALLSLALLAAGALIAIIQPAPRAVAGQTALDRGNESKAAIAKEHRVTVTLRDSAGRPVQGATVYLAAPMETQMYWISHPAGSDVEHGAVIRTYGTTDAEGRVTLQALLDLDALVIAASRYGIVPLRLVARAPDKGLATLPLRLDQTEATLDLPPETLIEGTLKAPEMAAPPKMSEFTSPQ
jgi:beta-lactamase regulating signal transducer with metallopeptidase domain